MKLLLLTPLLLILLPSVFADERQREIEYEAINLVIQKYGKGLENRLKGTGLNLVIVVGMKMIVLSVLLLVLIKNILGQLWNGSALMSVLSPPK